MKNSPNRKRRGRGEGSISQRAEDGLWVAWISAGYDAKGKRIRRAVYGKTKQEVQGKLLDLQQSARQGLPVKPEKILVRTHLEDWLAVKKGEVASGTYLRYKYSLETYAVPFLGHVRLSDLDYRKINALYKDMDDRELAPRTVFDLAAVLRSALDDAVRKGLIPKNPSRLAAKRKPGKKEARCMTPEEIRWFREGIKGNRLENAFTFALGTGCRPGEWLGLPLDAADLDAGKVSFRQALHEEEGQIFIGDVKTKKSRRTISLPQDCIEALRRQRAAQAEARLKAGGKWQGKDLFFTTTTGGLLRRTNVDGREFAWAIQRGRELAAKDYEKNGMNRSEAQAAAGKLFAGVTLHTLRHTHASVLIAAGIDIMTVSRRLGHETARITLETYGHLLPGQDEKAAEALDRLSEIGNSLATVDPKKQKSRNRRNGVGTRVSDGGEERDRTSDLHDVNVAL